MTLGKLISPEDAKLYRSMLLFIPACAAGTVVLVAVVGLLVS